jgi:hypothetical protein
MKMKITDGYIKYIEEWYGFYKSINNKNSGSNWLMDLTLDFYENKLSHLYHLKQNDDTDISIHDLPDRIF